MAKIPMFLSLDHSCLKKIKPLMESLSPTLQLALSVLYLRSTGDHSLRPYMDMLPQQVTNALQLTDAHRNELKGTCIEDELNVSMMEERHKVWAGPGPAWVLVVGAVGKLFQYASSVKMQRLCAVCDSSTPPRPIVDFTASCQTNRALRSGICCARRGKCETGK